MADLGRRLAAGRPGRAAMQAMAPEGRQYVPASEALAEGAALAAAVALLYPPKPASAEAWIALTLRRADMRVHPGQVSLPGGRIDPGETVETAALRELSEELAVTASEVALLGRLSPLYIAPSGFVLQAVVATSAKRPGFRPNPAEVAAVIETPLASFVGSAHRRRESRSFGDPSRSVPFFEIQGHKVWGATAMLLAELAAAYDAEGSRQAAD